MAISSP
ncbi:hypothetical protein E2C01_077579 [Portunus trituberculatus]|nr:hypothetical protein [Portunus trituberculatus]